MKQPTANPDEKILMSRNDAAEAISVSLRRIDELLKTGELRSVRLGGRVLIPRTALLELAAR